MIVPLYLEIDEVTINWVDKYLIDLGPGTPAVAEGNSLVLTGINGPFALRVFWPSAGVHSLIIYTLVMLAFLLKIEIPLNRRLAYFVIGTLWYSSSKRSSDNIFIFFSTPRNDQRLRMGSVSFNSRRGHVFALVGRLSHQHNADRTEIEDV